MHKFALILLSLYTGLFLYAVSTAFVVPCITTLVSRYGEHHQKGIIIGIFRYTGICGICHRSVLHFDICMYDRQLW